MTQQPDTLEQWVRFLSEEEMPVLAHTARHVAGISAQSNTSVAALAQVVLLDSAMTARLLRLANSVYYNPTSNRISTVSRAIVMLGFETVRTIALSIAMVDTLLRGQQHERVVKAMAEAFHAAVQAKSFAAARGESASEEVFIATLLYRLGYMAFWCFSDTKAARLEEALQAPSARPAKIERDVLGFTLNELTAALNREWHLSELLGRALAGDSTGDTQITALELGVLVARTASDSGWESPDMRQAVARVAQFIDVSVEDATVRVHANARHAIKAAHDYGVEVAGRYIPLPRDMVSGRVEPERSETAERQSAAEFQLRILREVSAMLAERVDINALLGMVLEGIYRGVDTDRAVFAIVGADGSRLTAKYALGEGRDTLMQQFNFPLGSQQHHIFAKVLEGGEAVWLGKSPGRWRQYLTPAITACLGETDFFAMPLALGGRAKGLFYADRSSSGRPLDERSFDSFRHFCEQALIGLAMLGGRPAGG